jgi:ASC-1-like (ASCH) protein
MPSRKKTSRNQKLLKKLRKMSFSKQPSEKQKLCSGQKMTPDYVKDVQEPWFSLIALGLKTVEGRLNKGSFKDMKVGETVLWTNEQQGFKREILTRISRITKYTGFEDYLQTETLPKCLPGILNIEQGLSVYYKLFLKEDESRYGVLAIEVEII